MAASKSNDKKKDKGEAGGHHIHKPVKMSDLKKQPGSQFTRRYAELTSQDKDYLAPARKEQARRDAARKEMRSQRHKAEHVDKQLGEKTGGTRNYYAEEEPHRSNAETHQPERMRDKLGRFVVMKRSLRDKRN